VKYEVVSQSGDNEVVNCRKFDDISGGHSLSLRLQVQEYFSSSELVEEQKGRVRTCTNIAPERCILMSLIL